MDQTEKVRENRLRRAAQRQGLYLAKSRRRDTRAWDYGTYMLLDMRTNGVFASGSESGFGLTLDQIEEALKRRSKERAARFSWGAGDVKWVSE